MTTTTTEVQQVTTATFISLDARLGSRSTVRLGNNTTAERRGDDAIAIRLHATDVLTFSRDERVTYDTGGWETVTTKARMNAYGPARVYAVSGVWYLRHYGREYVYADGVTVDAWSTEVTGAGSWVDAGQRARANRGNLGRRYGSGWAGPTTSPAPAPAPERLCAPWVGARVREPWPAGSLYGR